MNNKDSFKSGTGMEGFRKNSDCGDGNENIIIKPEIGMKFDSVEEAWEFYKSFAKESGFPVIKRSSKKNVMGELRSCTFTCGRAGTYESTSEKPLNPQPTTRCGCLAKLVVRLDQYVGWVISKIVFEHNHELSPDKARYYRCNRDISSRVRDRVNLLDRSQTSVKVNVSYRRSTVEQERYNDLNILFNEVANRAVKVEAEFNDIKQWLVMKLEMLKKHEETNASEPKSPGTNECQEGEEGNEGDDVGGKTNDVLDPKSKRRYP